MNPSSNGIAYRVLGPLYQWGARLAGTGLLLGVVLQLLSPNSPGGDPAAGSLAEQWFQGVLLTLWSIPVAAVLTVGLAWVVRRPADRVGWLALLIGVFLLSLWMLS